MLGAIKNCILLSIEENFLKQQALTFIHHILRSLYEAARLPGHGFVYCLIHSRPHVLMYACLVRVETMFTLDSTSNCIVYCAIASYSLCIYQVSTLPKPTSPCHNSWSRNKEVTFKVYSINWTEIHKTEGVVKRNRRFSWSKMASFSALFTYASQTSILSRDSSFFLNSTAFVVTAGQFL